ncbi:hypothetical protein BDA96_08G074700 [Sorghum bicolor]|uniref:Uncharacterized protein n=1 Tax=Sorghum bicolor TaxID=4558 RepID=A0A921QE56_SORBI|nr:hypothetical protein BDA96_08G074700 [Sorghum bicolor]
MSADAIWENKIMAEARWYLLMLSTISWHGFKTKLNSVSQQFGMEFKYWASLSAYIYEPPHWFLS